LKFLKNKKIIIGAIIVALAAAIFFASRDKGPQYGYAEVKRGNILQEVSVTGRVKPAEAVDLAFEITGRVRSVNVKVGDEVFAGTVLARLDATELAAELTKAESDLIAQEAKRSEAETNLSNAYAGAVDVLNDAYLKADEAVHFKTEPLFTTNGNFYQLTFQTCDAIAETALLNERTIVEGEFKKWASELNDLTKLSPPSDIERILAESANRLAVIKKFFDDLDKILNLPCTLNQSSLDDDRVNINAARGNVNTAMANVNGREQSLLSLQAALASANAALKSSEANTERIKAQIAKTVLISPIRGVVSVVGPKVGEIVGGGAAVISVISASNLEIEANVPEADVAKIKVGDEAKITLDAYGDAVAFRATVTQIDPAEKIIEGVPTYRTKLQFKEKDDRIKSGMTANIDILAAEKENAIYVPARAIISAGGRTYVRIWDGKKLKEADIQTGLRGSDGNVEVVSGVEEGEKVVTFEK